MSSQKPAPPRHIASQHGLRGLAALAVVIYHANDVINSRIASVDGYTGLILKQYLAVDLFFLMSGFIMCHVYSQRLFDDLGRNLAEFWIGRAARLLPLFYFTFALYLLVTGLLYAGGALDSFFSERNTPGSIIANLFLVQSWGILDHLSWNYPSWSISTELFAYLVFPLILAGRRFAPGLFPYACLTIGMLLYIALEMQFGTIHKTHDFGLIRCIAGFTMGVGMYFLAHDREQLTTLTLRYRLDLVSVALMLLAMHLALSDSLIMLIMVAVIIFTLSDTGVICTLLKRAPIQKLGDLSYSVYLNHAVILLVISTLGMEQPAPSPATIYTIAWHAGLLALYVVLTIVMSSYTYRLLEVPGRKYVKNALSSRFKLQGAL